MKYSIKSLIVLIVLFTSIKFEAQYTNYFQNYSIADYKAGNQNWDIQKADDGKIYVANNDGLLEFDGLNWNLWKLPNDATVRSILVDNDKIYVGSYEDFGYFKRDNRGSLLYTSIKKTAKNSQKVNQEFWQIKKFKNEIIFRSFARIYIFENYKIRYFDLPSTIMSVDIVDESILISTLNDGIFTFKNNRITPFFNKPILNDKKIISISKISLDKLLITTELNGLFILKNNKLKSFNCEINNRIKKHQLNRFSVSKNNIMVFGTIKNGIYITDSSGSILQNITKKDGLINNTVLGQYLTKDNQLWVGLDNGISFVNLTTSTTFYNDKSGTLGAVYDVINFNNTIYIGSNTGLYYIDKLGKLQFVKGSQGQVWFLKNIKGNLICGHNYGTFLVKKNKLTLIGNNSGGWVFKKVPEFSNMYLAGTYTGLIRYKTNSSKWDYKYYKKIHFPVRHLVFEDGKTVWVAHPSEGIYRIKFDKSFDTITEVKDYSKKGLWNSYGVEIFKIKNTVVFHTKNGWEKYEPLLDSIVPFKLLTDKISSKSNLISEEFDNSLIFKSKNSLIKTSYPNLKEQSQILINFIKNRIIKGNEKISILNDSTSALNLYDGFMLFNSKKTHSEKKIGIPKIESVIINGKAESLDSNQFEIPFSNNFLKIVLTSPFSTDKLFEYKLSNFYSEGSWQTSTNGIIEFSNLSDGSYTLTFRQTDSNLNKSNPLTFDFIVLKPWYKGSIGLTIYGFLVLLIIYIIYKSNKRKIKKEQKLLKNKYEEQQMKIIQEREIENEKRLFNLKNESLKNEIKLKSKELANIAMALVRKNETLLHLKQKLMINRANFNDDYSFKKIVKEIDNSIEHKDEWELFEHNFNKVHEDFFNLLKEKHPVITGKDLKTCAYIKMNLTSKEIAPLLNISVRGVETQRYRIKQKLGINSSESLSFYLQNLN